MSRARLLCLSVVGALASVVLVAGPAQATTYTLSGVVRDAAGAPVAGIGVDSLAGFSTSPTEWKTATTTAADGSYQLSVPSDAEEVSLFIVGDYLGDQLYARTQTFQMTGDRVENVTLPVGATARVTVVDGDGAPLVDATVTSTERFALTPTSGGLDLISRFGSDTCDTPASGVCEFTAFRGGSIESFGVQPPGSTEVAHFDGMDTPDAVNEKELVVGLDHVGGTLRASDGSAVEGATVQLVRSGGFTSTTTSDAAGQFAFSVLPGGGTVLTASGTVTEGSRSGPFTLTTSPFDISGPRSETITLPSLASLVVDVQDSLGASVTGARILFSGDGSTSASSTSSGITFVAALYPTSGSQPSCTGTDDSGECRFTVFRGGSTSSLLVIPRGGSLQQFPGIVTDADPTTFVARLDRYVTAPSVGTIPGRVAIETSDSAVDLPTLTSAPIYLPAGLEAVVGSLSYRVAVPSGGSTLLRITLPPAAQPNAVLRVGPGGELTDITERLTLEGAEFTLQVVDGGVDDDDGIVNGSVTESVVPVVRARLAVETTTLPAAAVNSTYEARLSASGPVPPYVWRLGEGQLPPGLTLRADGVISGTPTSVGTYRFDVVVHDSTGSRMFAVGTLTLTVATVVVATKTVPDAYQGGAYSYTLKRAGGGGIASWKLVDGSLPPGMRLSSTGALLGTPTSVGTYSFGVVVSSGGKTSPRQGLTLVVRPMEVATTSLPDGTVGKWYSQALATRGGKGTLSWTLVDGSLPTNLRLTSAGRITGTPRTPGTWTFTVRVADSSVPKQVATRTLSLTVR